MLVKGVVKFLDKVRVSMQNSHMSVLRGTQRQFSENICSEDDLI